MPPRLPLGQLPDLRLEPTLASADLSENRRGLFEMIDGVIRAASRVQQVGEIAMQRRLVVTVALRYAQSQSRLRESQRLFKLPAGPIREGEIIERCNTRTWIAQHFGQREATCQMLARQVDIASAAGEDAQHVVALGERRRLTDSFRQLQCLLSELLGLRRPTTPVGEEAPVRIEPGTRSGRSDDPECGPRGLKVALGQVPLATTAIHVA